MSDAMVMSLWYSGNFCSSKSNQSSFSTRITDGAGARPLPLLGLALAVGGTALPASDL